MKKANGLKDAEVVYCTNCGEKLLRQPVTPDKGHSWPCYRWFDPAGNLADNCPGCGAITSALTTSPAALSRAMILERLGQLGARDQAMIYAMARRIIEVAERETPAGVPAAERANQKEPAFTEERFNTYWSLVGTKLTPAEWAAAGWSMAALRHAVRAAQPKDWDMTDEGIDDLAHVIAAGLAERGHPMTPATDGRPG